MTWMRVQGGVTQVLYSHNITISNPDFQIDFSTVEKSTVFHIFWTYSI